MVEFVCEKVRDGRERRSEVKDLKTKETGDIIVELARGMNFPQVREWLVFQEFMHKAQQWSDRAMRIIQDFKDNVNVSNSRQLIEESRHCLHSKFIEEELSRIEVALKWREKISRKMTEQSPLSFSR